MNSRWNCFRNAMAWKVLNIMRTPRHRNDLHVISRASGGRQMDCEEGRGRAMTRMVMMWLFGVPLSVMLLFMVFGVI